MLQSICDDFGNVQIVNFFYQKALHGDFIGRIENARSGTTSLHRFVGEL